MANEKKSIADLKDSIAWIKHLLGDPDIGHFYSREECLRMQSECDQLEAELRERKLTHE